MSFAQTLQFLMDREGLTNYQLAKDLGCHQTSIKNWLDGSVPQKLMQKKIADYFHIPIDFLLGRTPFDFWDSIEANRKAFIDASSVDAKLLGVIWNVDFDFPEKAPLEYFLRFINEAISFAALNADGTWNVEIKENFKGKTAGPFLKIGSPRMEAENLAFHNDVLARIKENAPAETGERKVNEEDIKFALFGGEGEITDAMYNEVRRFAQMVKMREEAEKKGR